MIYLNVNNADYYDEVRVLVKSFFPYEETTVEGALPETDFFLVNIDENRIHIDACIGSGENENHFEKSVEAENSDKRIVKDVLKDILYRMLNEMTGKSLPWGMLTGVRPTKIAMSLLENGKSEKEAIEYLQQKYLVSERKAKLSLRVAQKEKNLLENINYQNGYSLYIGIPFCPTTCLYCSFSSYPLSIWGKKVEAYVDSLIQEMKEIGALYKGRKPESIYFGGGTPTTLDPEQLDRILTALEDNFDVKNVRELTVEAGRPDSITKEKLLVLRKHGVDRISINPQTMKQETLDLIGRHHTVEQIVDRFKLARECGFENINMDLIVGLPGETKEDVQNTMERIIELAPDSITVHSLAIKRAAALKIWQKKNVDYQITNTDEIINMTADYTEKIGLEPYYLYRQRNMAGNFENVGYSQPGKECLYNILIMEEKQTILALGAGGSSKFYFPKENRIERVENVKDVKSYIERVDEMIERKKKFILENPELL